MTFILKLQLQGSHTDKGEAKVDWCVSLDAFDIKPQGGTGAFREILCQTLTQVTRSE